MAFHSESSNLLRYAGQPRATATETGAGMSRRPLEQSIIRKTLRL